MVYAAEKGSYVRTYALTFSYSLTKVYLAVQTDEWFTHFPRCFRVLIILIRGLATRKVVVFYEG